MKLVEAGERGGLGSGYYLETVSPAGFHTVSLVWNPEYEGLTLEVTVEIPRPDEVYMFHLEGIEAYTVFYGRMIHSLCYVNKYIKPLEIEMKEAMEPVLDNFVNSLILYYPLESAHEFRDLVEKARRTVLCLRDPITISDPDTYEIETYL